MHWLVVVLALLLSQNVLAHDLGVARVSLNEQREGGFLVAAKLPVSFEAEVPLFPEHCQLIEQSSHPLPNKNRKDIWVFTCQEPLTGDDMVAFPWKREGAFVAARWLDGSESGQFFRAEGNHIQVALQTLRDDPRAPDETAVHYLTLGMEHILLGWDHLAFVLALCLIARRWQLVKLVTAFTVGHSLTLALAVLGWAHIPMPPVEACIALSIAFVAAESLRGQSRLHHGLGLVFSFGLLHGLGFASALEESGIEQSELLLGLLTFNLGVEAGQLLFVLLVMSLVLCSQPFGMKSWMKPAAAFGLGTLGMFWTIERIAGFGL